MTDTWRPMTTPVPPARPGLDPPDAPVSHAPRPVLAREIRPRFHLTPPSGWMNDPNGPIFIDGRLHVFFQHNPGGPYWDRIHWGHAVSEDMVTWTPWPIAISPAVDGPDSFGCWSGCVVLDADGTPTMLYTGVRLDGIVRRASVCIATSPDDLRTWVKAPVPVIEGAPPGYAADAFRDPFVWRDDDTWSMLLGAGTSTGAGAILLYRSDDLRAWRLVGPFLSHEDLPDAAQAGGPCWECPQLLRFGERDVLIISITDPAPEARPSHVIAITGRRVGERFIPERLERLDAGPGFYAPAAVEAPDGRRLLLGWVPEDPPAPGSERDWAGAMTLPREITQRPDGGLGVAPARELMQMRGPMASWRDRAIGPDPSDWLELPMADWFETQLVIDPGDADTVGVEVRDGEELDPEFRITFRPRARTVSVTRRGTVTVGGPDDHNVMVLPLDAPLALELRMIVDGSVLEAFVDGRATATFRLPSVHAGGRRLVVWSTGAAATVRRLDTWALPPGRG